ncbi:MAG TPA: hypothetical protein VEW26_06885 [Allosphingosinicella sp.]|nr:hypothetical protein [Allosphingosinicella sp.]
MKGRDLLDTARGLQASDDPLAERLRLRREILALRRYGHRSRSISRLSDGLAKFGGGSLLTATLLLLLQGTLTAGVVGIFGLTLLLFLAGTIFSTIFESNAADWELEADALEAVLAERRSGRKSPWLIPFSSSRSPSLWCASAS